MTSEHNKQIKSNLLKTINKAFIYMFSFVLIIGNVKALVYVTLLILDPGITKMTELYSKDEWLGLLLIAIGTFGLSTLVFLILNIIYISLMRHFLKTHTD